MTVLVLGATGMLGHTLMRVLPPVLRVIGTMRGPVSAELHPALRGCELVGGVQAEDIDSVTRVLAQTKPDAVINCVGIVKQAVAAKDPLACIGVNSMFPHRLANLCRLGNARLIHISTDCVFSGRSGNYRESDFADAEDLYGRSKFLGEVSGAGCLTLRTSIIGRELYHPTGLLEWFLGQRGRPTKGYANAHFSGFTTPAISEVIKRVLTEHPSLEGVWHVAAESIDKFSLLKLLNEKYQLGISVERDEVFHCDRRLDGSRFQDATGLTAPSWSAMVEQLLSDSQLYQ